MVELIGVTGGYGRQMAVQDFSLTLPSGEVAALVGPNGCGKSTLLRMAAGIVPPSAGQVLLKGRHLSGFSRRELGQLISYLPQSRPVPGISVQSMVMHGRFPYLGYPRRYRKEDWQMVQKAMEWAGVTHLAGRDMSRLSGGERQKVYFAMCLAQDSQVLFLDEPTTYLDLSHQFEIMELTRQLKQAGKTVIMVLHDLNLAARYSDLLFAIRNGAVYAGGESSHVLTEKNLEEIFEIEATVFEDTINHCPYFIPIKTI